ncbi:MAG: hypothetical protein EA392_09735 [Cryomorphaceae bacterium]|nr:MAG: hypothetical protein EA392_09735 [Cryomorphaceae bacterium]
MRFVIFYIALCFCFTAVMAQENYEVKPASKLNSSHSDFAAIPFGDTVVFCSNKRNDIVVSRINANNEMPLTSLYIAPVKQFGKYGMPKAFPFEKALHTDFGPATFRNKREMYVTMSYQGNEGPVLGIFISTLQDNGKWSDPKAFEHNNPDCHVAHPTFSADGNTLYFSANFSDGLGRADIYTSTFLEGEWSTPRNLGSDVNTPHSELFPFAHPDGSLYFASNRPGGMGGLDIYHFSEGNTLLLSDPFNSAFDDYALYLSADNSAGYLSSGRNGQDDVFTIQMVRPVFENCDTLQQNSYCYLFYDAATMNIDSLPLQYEWAMGDGTKYRGLEADHCYQHPGKYTVLLNVVDTLTGDLFFSQASYELEVKDIEQVFINSADSILPGETLKLDGLHTNIQGLKANTYHWYFEDGTYKEGAAIEHVFYEPGVQNVVLGVRSESNAAGVVQQACIMKPILVTEEIEGNLLVTAEPKAIAGPQQKNDPLLAYLKSTNDTVGVYNNVPADAVYRVEITKSKERLSTLDEYFDQVREAYDIIENYVSADSIFSYAVGAERELKDTYPIYAYVKSIHYNEASVKAYLPEHVYDLDEIDEIDLSNLNRAVFRTGLIHFETGLAAIPESAHSTIGKITRLLLDYPEINMIVGAHTDDTGSDAFNTQLSQKRALAVIKALEQQGIDASRLVGIGYGSEIPLGDNRTESGRQLNRRVEFKVLERTKK